MEDNLSIPDNLKFPGFTVYCNGCKRNIKEICKLTRKDINTCVNKNRHTFKIYGNVPHGKGKRETYNIKTRNPIEAQQEAVNFINRLKNTGIVEPEKPPVKISNSRSVKQVPVLLNNALARYASWMSGEGVPSHIAEEKSSQHIKDIERAIILLAQVLVNAGYNLKELEVSDIDDELVGIVYDNLIKVKKFSPRTTNKYLGYYTSFLKWYADEYNPAMKNFFKRALRKEVSHNPETINEQEFEKLISVIKKENGIKKYYSKIKPQRNLYQDYLVDAFKLGLYSGRRRHEIINFKYNDILDDGNGNYMIKSENYKVNRIKKLTGEQKKFLYTPVTPQLKHLLLEMGWEKYKDTGNFILAPELKINRGRFMEDSLSRGFSHFFSLTGSTKKLQFGTLRKTYISSLTAYLGNNSRLITGHSGQDVIERHYLDKRLIVQTANNFEVFPTTNGRTQELEELRNNHNKKNMEVSK